MSWPNTDNFTLDIFFFGMSWYMDHRLCIGAQQVFVVNFIDRYSIPYPHFEGIDGQMDKFDSKSLHAIEQAEHMDNFKPCKEDRCYILEILHACRQRWEN